MKFETLRDYDALSERAAGILFDAIRDDPRIVLGLPTGRTPIGMYARVVATCERTYHCFRDVATFNLDEYAGIPPTHPGSYCSFMKQNLFDRVDIDPKNAHIPNGMASDLDAECARYEQTIRKVGGIDLQLLGVGRAGHIGFNEPLSALQSRTRVKALAPATIDQNAPLFGGADKVPRRAITMGVGTIIESRRCLLLATGASKAGILAKAVEGPITAMISATALQLHQRCTVVVDEAAAGKLQGADYYRWIFANEPEWEGFR